jgi:hypothetical protein
MENMTIYEKNGYKDRSDYLKCLANENNVSFDTVYCLADALGPEEDFDDLVSGLENNQLMFLGEMLMNS